jgi:hypothetical protein
MRGVVAVMLAMAVVVVAVAVAQHDINAGKARCVAALV